MRKYSAMGKTALRSLVLGACALAAVSFSPAAGAQAQGAEKAPATAAPPAPAGEAAPEGDGDKAKKEPPPSVTGGYSWSDKPRKRRRATKKRHKVDPNAPVATYPGFMMLPDGTSQVWVYVNKKVPVQVSGAQGRTTFVLTGADIAVWNNTHALVTHYFPTPLSKAQLRRDAAGAQLVLDFRESVQPSHKVVDGPRGTMILRITLPKAKQDWSVPQAGTAKGGAGGATLPPK